MKNIFTFLFGLAFSIAVTAQTNVYNLPKSKIKNTQTNNPSSVTNTQTSVVPVTDTEPAKESLSLKETEFDFGKIPQGKPVTHVFEFTNTGTTPFSIFPSEIFCPIELTIS